MAAYVTTDDFEDDVLKDIMDDTDISYASNELELLVTDRLLLSAADIKVPLNLMVKEFVLAVAYARRAKLTVGMGNRLQDGIDVYAYKSKSYRDDADRLEKRITPSMITGTISSGTWSASIPLYRG